jgi:hypothetical protein
MQGGEGEPKGLIDGSNSRSDKQCVQFRRQTYADRAVGTNSGVSATMQTLFAAGATISQGVGALDLGPPGHPQPLQSNAKCSGHERGILFVAYTVHGHAHVILSRVYAHTTLSDMHTRYIVLGALQFQIRLCICFIQ